jgi:hypothetical protein
MNSELSSTIRQVIGTGAAEVITASSIAAAAAPRQTENRRVVIRDFAMATTG